MEFGVLCWAEPQIHSPQVPATRSSSEEEFPKSLIRRSFISGPSKPVPDICRTSVPFSDALKGEQGEAKVLEPAPG